MEGRGDNEASWRKHGGQRCRRIGAEEEKKRCRRGKDVGKKVLKKKCRRKTKGLEE